ncbi:SMC-Scp complex subunit ScpB [Micromonospora echinofusca]|uniref:SMC-Scp complex subunit ScpB n=1 Tax=Micromonospora echinofusca TaxID=47858 RepID=UPI0037234AF9
MSSDERRDSLADQAAAWVPPWQRPTAPSAAPETEDPGDSAPPEGPEPTKISGEIEGAAESAAPDVPVEAGGVGETGGVEGGRGSGEGRGVGEGKGGRGSSAKGSAGRRQRASAPEPPPELDDTELRGALEAILLVVDEPVSELILAQVLEQPAERIGPLLDEIAAGYTAAGHGFELRRAAGGWRLYTRPEYATYVERFVLDGQSVRLTQAALETLAVIAYKQPVTRSRISAIRGVNCDGVIRTLVSRGLVEECGTEPDSGAFLYRTTTMFLEKLGLNSVDDLPPLAPFLPDDVEELADATR